MGMGVVGSALATVCGQAISCATVLWYFCLTKGVPMRLRLRMMPLHGETVRLILSLGLASFAVQAGMAAVNFVLNNLLNMYGAQSPIGAEGALASIAWCSAWPRSWCCRSSACRSPSNRCSASTTARICSSA